MCLQPDCDSLWQANGMLTQHGACKKDTCYSIHSCSPLLQLVQSSDSKVEVSVHVRCNVVFLHNRQAVAIHPMKPEEQREILRYLLQEGSD